MTITAHAPGEGYQNSPAANRRFRFRIWDNERSCWDQPVFKGYEQDIHHLLIDADGRLFDRTATQFVHESLFPERYELFQWTGIRTWDGADIYEGDIVLASAFWFDGAAEADKQYTGVIVWHEGEYQIHPSLDTPFWGSDGSPNLYWTRFGDDELRVIGNIKENPELLKEVHP